MTDDATFQTFQQAAKASQEAAQTWQLFTFLVIGSTVLWAVMYDARRRR